MPKYFGSKNNYGMYQNIINEIPPHENYYELFLGSGAVICNKKRAPGLNIGVELVRSVIDQFTYPGSVEVINTCAIKFLKDLVLISSEEDFIYLDPPYELDIRRSPKKVYKNELTKQDHRDIANTLLSSRARVIISTYPGSVYEEILKGWRKKEFVSYTRAGKSTEVIYLNFPVPEMLHDYSFLGKNKTQRQAIKRKITGYVEKFKKLPVQERNAILSTLQQTNFNCA